MRDVARIIGWLYMIPLVLFLLFFGVPLAVRGVWWVFLWPAAIIAAPLAAEFPHMIVPVHHPYFWASVVVSILWMTVGLWTIADHFFVSKS